MDRFVKKFKTYIPATFPISIGQVVALGDYGILKNGFFIREGNIAEDFYLTFKRDVDKFNIPQKCELLHGSNVSFSPEVGANISDLYAAEIKINFIQENSFYYQSTFSSCLSIVRPRITMNELIMDLYKKHLWQKKFVIITAILQSKNMLKVESNNAGQQVIFRCESDSPIAEFEDIKASAKISYKSNNSSVIKHTISGEQEMGIAFQLCKIKGLWSKSVEKLSTATELQEASITYDMTYEEYTCEDNNPYDEDINYEFVNIK